MIEESIEQAHQALWYQVINAWQQQRLPHALLLRGPAGMGKHLFAQRLAALLLCEHPHSSGEPCRRCKPCHLVQTGQHPDFLLIQPADTGKQIQVDQIRHLIQFCALTAYYQSYQMVMIQPAEAMNHNAANSLLKLLEEPPAKTLLLLVSHLPMKLTATIRSRCQSLDFSRPDQQVVENWLRQQLPPTTDISLLLNLSDHAPLTALAEAQNLTTRQTVFDGFKQLLIGQTDPLRIAETWSQLEATQVLKWMMSWTMDLIRYAASGQSRYGVNRDYQDILQRLTHRFNLQDLFKMLDLQRETYQLVYSTANIKIQGLLEQIAITWFELSIQERKR
ncbi:MAG: DNA polymerase III subunit delta' [Beggiatoa sp. IS2]|nr:MAG: DNA polymerase III subunit delta' [Beggiatoa sp. IS2]